MIPHYAGIIVSDPDYNLFYVQQKDRHYKVPGYAGAYSFFGGTVEQSETDDAAMLRELQEELQPCAANIIIENTKGLFTLTGRNAVEQICRFSIYEAVLDRRTLQRIAAMPVFEGERGALVQKELVKGLRLTPPCDQVWLEYCKAKGI